jgi:hypothetical protein
VKPFAFLKLGEVGRDEELDERPQTLETDRLGQDWIQRDFLGRPGTPLRTVSQGQRLANRMRPGGHLIAA